MKTTVTLTIKDLEGLGLQGWGDCGLEWDEESQRNVGYLYPITHREGGYMDNCLSLATVIGVLDKSRYVIREDGYIDLW